MNCALPYMGRWGEIVALFCHAHDMGTVQVRQGVPVTLATGSHRAWQQHRVAQVKCTPCNLPSTPSGPPKISPVIHKCAQECREDLAGFSFSREGRMGGLDKIHKKCKR